MNMNGKRFIKIDDFFPEKSSLTFALVKLIAKDTVDDDHALMIKRHIDSIIKKDKDDAPYDAGHRGF